MVQRYSFYDVLNVVDFQKHVTNISFSTTTLDEDQSLFKLDWQNYSNRNCLILAYFGQLKSSTDTAITDSMKN